MCGISGEIRLDGRRADVAAVEAMTDALAPRGPDGSGVWASGPRALGHRRLAIIDLSHAGDQPMVDPELGLTVVFNGCIYNHKELRRELETKGYRFFSNSDTEVIAKAYHCFGDDFVDRLIGMFAFAIVERDSGRTVLGRDRLGIKPLYLAEHPGGLRFASTVPALLAGSRAGGSDGRRLDTSIDPVALFHYLTFHAIVPAPRTLLKGITKLPAATLLVVEPDGRRHQHEYWAPPRHDGRAPGSGAVDGTRSDWSPQDWHDAISQALRTAVKRRLVADVPVGVLLSGGLDSSLIVGLLAEQGQHRLATFSIGFDTIGDEEGDEFAYSDVIAQHFETDHHQIRVPTAEVLDVLPATVGAMSEPMVSHDVVAFYLLSREVAKHVKVVQSGQGADEVFAGYHWYQTLSGATGPAMDEYADVFFDRDPSLIAAVVSPGLLADGDPSRRFVEEHFGLPGAPTTVDKALRIDSHVMLVEDPVKRVDNMTMAWGLEARVPFLDHELVELAAACPVELKLAGGGKGIIKDIAREVIPPAVIDRPKGYFPVPPLIHLEGPYVEMLRSALTSDAARARGLFRPEQVDALLAEPNQLTRLRYNQLWEIGLVELWLQHNGV